MLSSFPWMVALGVPPVLRRFPYVQAAPISGVWLVIAVLSASVKVSNARRDPDTIAPAA